MTDVGHYVEHAEVTHADGPDAGFPVAGIVCAVLHRRGVDPDTGEMVEWDEVRVRPGRGRDMLIYAMWDAAQVVDTGPRADVARIVRNRIVGELARRHNGTTKQYTPAQALALADAVTLVTVAG